jgi:hypothetical protein
LNFRLSPFGAIGVVAFTDVYTDTCDIEEYGRGYVSATAGGMIAVGDLQVQVRVVGSYQSDDQYYLKYLRVVIKIYDEDGDEIEFTEEFESEEVMPTGNIPSGGWGAAETVFTITVAEDAPFVGHTVNSVEYHFHLGVR